MSDAPETVRCMVAETQPMYWSLRRPVDLSKGMKRFLKDLLDPAHDGVAYVRSRQMDWSAAPGDKWLTGEAGVAWLSDLGDRWLGLASELATGRQVVSDRVFDELSEPENIPRVFFDDHRLYSFMGQKLPADAPRRFFVLTSDWSYYDDAISWCPQVVASTHWPYSRTLAPHPESAAVGLLDPEKAAALLDGTLYSDISRLTEFRLLYDLPYHYTAVPRGDVISVINIRPPVFYGAFVNAPNVSGPLDLLENEHRATLTSLAQQALGTGRLDSRSLSSDVIDGRFATYRRELVGETQANSFYLLAGVDDGVAGLAEERFVHVSDQFAYVSSIVAENATNSAPLLLDCLPQLGICNASLEQANQVTRDLRATTALLPLSTGRRRRISDLMRHISVSFADSRGGVTRALGDLWRTQSDWEDAVEAANAAVLDRISADPVGLTAVDGETRRLNTVGSLTVVTEVNRLVKQASLEGTRLKEQLDETSTQWQAMVDYEHEADRAWQDRQSRMVGFGLAGIAVFTAVPILTGQYNWAELRQEATGWTDLSGFVAAILTRVHTPLVVGAVVGSAAVMLFLLFGLLRMTVGSMVRRRELVPFGRRLQRVRSANAKAAGILSRLTEASGAERATLVRRLDSLDDEICSDIEQLWKRLAVLENRAERGFHVSRIRRRVRLLLLWQELFQNRPNPLWTPRALAVYRYLSERVAGLMVVSESEFATVMRRYGFDPAERNEINTLAIESAHLEPGQFSRYLNSIGINADRRGWQRGALRSSEADLPARPELDGGQVLASR
jgi:hypothetical protein